MIAFGPVSSRRLGKSLGINNITAGKHCSYSCIYCQIGRTRNVSSERRVFYKPEILVQEVAKHLDKLDEKDTPDFLTFVSTGEPTLDSNIGEEIKLLKKFGIPIAVITNASLIFNNEVRQDLINADWVSLKVDSVNENIWRIVNCPDQSIDFNNFLKGLEIFSRSFSGSLNTETMLIEGYNDLSADLKQTASFIALLKPEKAFISIPVRPPAIRSLKPVSEEKLLEAWEIYKNAGIHTELLSGFEGSNVGSTGNAYDDILNITAVHPLREDSLNNLLKKNMSDNSVIKSLIAKRLIIKVKYKGENYYIRRYNI